MRSPPPADVGPSWPFRLRVRALGGFELVRDGLPMRFTGKAQQRPLDLLKLLVALGGQDVDTPQLMAALWPDADGAAAKTSFDTTLFRLRKLLEVDNALGLAGGKLSLSRALAWTDVWALRGGARCGGSARARIPGRRRPASRGSCSMPTRGRCSAPRKTRGSASRARCCARAFVRTLMRLGEALEREREWVAAIDLYRRGIEADNLAESLYRGLMRCAGGDRRPGRGDQRVPALPRAPVHRAGGRARRGNRAAVPGNRRRTRQDQPAVSLL